MLDGCKKIVKTPSGGWHLYFTPDPNLTNRTNVSIGMDLRAAGGYVLAPPSFLETDDYSAAYKDYGEPTGGSDDPILWDEIVNAIAPTHRQTKEPVALLDVERRHSVAHLRAWLLERGYDPLYGARPLHRCLHHTVETLLSRKLLSDEVDPGVVLVVDRDGEELVISK